MTRTLKLLIAVATVLFLAFLIVGSTRASAEPQIVLVTLKDYQVQLSQFVVTPGSAVQFVVTNQGALPHRLVVKPYADAEAALAWHIPRVPSHGDFQSAGLAQVSLAGREAPQAEAEDAPVIAPATTRTIQRTLAPGIYRVVCTEWDHAARGMVDVLAAEVPRRVTPPLPVPALVSVLGLILGSAYILGDSLGLRLTRTMER